MSNYLLPLSKNKTKKQADQLLLDFFFMWLISCQFQSYNGRSCYIPGGGRRCAELHLLDMECVLAKPRPRLAERGRTGERCSPDWHTPWPMRQEALTAERLTANNKRGGNLKTIQPTLVIVVTGIMRCCMYLWFVGAKEPWGRVCVSHLCQRGSMKDQQLAWTAQGLETDKISDL